jgi:hypothetical protein
MDGAEQKIKSDHHPFLTPTIPFFHHSIIAWIIWRQTPLLWGEIKAWPFGPGFFTRVPGALKIRTCFLEAIVWQTAACLSNK